MKCIFYGILVMLFVNTFLYLPSSNAMGDWELLRDQEARLQMIKERRERLMDLDRKTEQEAWLADKRVRAADRAAHPEDVR